MPNVMPPFDPATGDQFGDQHQVVFPDAQKLIEESQAEHGVPDAGYRVARVPETNVYVMYGIDEASHSITLVCIRTYEGATN